jgi:hypothetical protein
MATFTRRTVLGVAVLCLAAAQLSATAAPDSSAAVSDSAVTIDRYPLTVCPVSGADLGSAPYVAQIEGREVRFCCAGCVSHFNSDTKRYFAKMDSMIVAAQTPDYPLNVCIVSGAALGTMASPVDVVQGNQLYRLCCAGCIERLQADPAGYAAKLNEAYAARAAAGGTSGPPACSSDTTAHAGQHAQP